jgi:hypothetical protein
MRTVAVIPAGAGLDTALAILTGLGNCYPPAALALRPGADPGWLARKYRQPTTTRPRSPRTSILTPGNKDLGHELPGNELGLLFTSGRPGRR